MSNRTLAIVAIIAAVLMFIGLAVKATVAHSGPVSQEDLIEFLVADAQNYRFISYECCAVDVEWSGDCWWTKEFPNGARYASCSSSRGEECRLTVGVDPICDPNGSFDMTVKCSEPLHTLVSDKGIEIWW
jgi:hypothetical protein